MDRNFETSRNLFALTTGNGAAPDWIQLTPNLASFSTQDGRGPFTIRNASDVIRASLLNGASIRIDYNHAIDLAAKAGLPSPAAGWIEEIAQHGPGNEPGLWGRVKWTPAGAKAIVDGEYRYISPVLLSRKNSGELVAIGGAALTNDPALVLKSLFARSDSEAIARQSTSTQETDPVNRQALCAALSLPATAADHEITAAISKSGADVKKKLASALGVPDNGTDEDLMSAAKRVGAQASTLANVTRVLQAAGLTGDTLDETTTVALCTKLKSSAAPAGGKSAGELQAQVDELQKNLASLNARLSGNDAKTEVEAMIASGKLTPAQKDWAIDYCSRDPEGFKKFAGAAPVIVKDGRITGGVVAEDGLNETERELCATLNLKPEDFKATRATMRKEGA